MHRRAHVGKREYHRVRALGHKEVEALDIGLRTRGHHTTVDQLVLRMRPGTIERLEGLHQPAVRAAVAVALRVLRLCALGHLPLLAPPANGVGRADGHESHRQASAQLSAQAVGVAIEEAALELARTQNSCASKRCRRARQSALRRKRRWMRWSGWRACCPRTLHHCGAHLGNVTLQPAQVTCCVPRAVAWRMAQTMTGQKRNIVAPWACIPARRNACLGRF